MHEVGIIEHNGQRFAANGATCDGRRLTAYVKADRFGRVTLTDWKGGALVTLRVLHGNAFTVNEFGETGDALLLRCGRGHYIGGLSLGSGMLFRGEHFTADNDDEAVRLANEYARCVAELDYDDALQPIEDDE